MLEVYHIITYRNEERKGSVDGVTTFPTRVF
jgi:hypothetical protein